jgi:acyl carrier protein
MNVAEFAAWLTIALDLDVTVPLHPHTGLYDDLGIDSIQALEMIFAIESHAGCDVPPDELPMLFTIGDAHEYHESLLVAMTTPEGDR